MQQLVPNLLTLIKALRLAAHPCIDPCLPILQSNPVCAETHLLTAADVGHRLHVRGLIAENLEQMVGVCLRGRRDGLRPSANIRLVTTVDVC